MLRDNIYIHPPSFLFLCLWECDISIEGRRPGHRTEYSAHVFNVKTSPAGSCSIFPQSTWALCPKRWDFLCIQVTGCSVINKPAANSMHLVDVVPYILKFIFSQRNRTEIPIFNQSLALCLSASGPFYFDRLKSFS